jgi:hypothetical protein
LTKRCHDNIFFHKITLSLSCYHDTFYYSSMMFYEFFICKFHSLNNNVQSLDMLNTFFRTPTLLPSGPRSTVPKDLRISSLNHGASSQETSCSNFFISCFEINVHLFRNVTFLRVFISRESALEIKKDSVINNKPHQLARGES